MSAVEPGPRPNTQPKQYRLKAAGSEGEHYLQLAAQGEGDPPAGAFALSLLAKAGTTDRLRLQLLDSQNNGAVADFNLRQGTASITRIGRAAKIRAPVEMLVGGWYKLTVTASLPESGARAIVQLLNEEGSHSFPAANRKTAGQYVSVMVANGTHWKTANKDISALSVYWKWLAKKGYCEANIWQGQSLSKRLAKASGKSAAKRAFTDKEVTTLFSGVPTSDPELRDAMYISALSGLRREEIARLKVSDCAGGVFRIRDAKTDAGNRDVPIHSRLRLLVAHRSKGRPVTSYLLHELPAPEPSAVGDRSDALGKRFKTLRRRLGVDEHSGDARQANVDFHSFRRWFDRTALAAHRKGAKGYDQWVLADVMGHEKGRAGLEMTVGVYAGPSPMGARKACVEAVRLPKRCPQWSASGPARSAG